MDAADALEDLGLTKYEAATFAALTGLGEATASEVHEESGVPRSNVYGVLDRLAEKGLVETAQSRPTLYRAVEPEEAMERLKRDRREREDRALRSLQETSTEARGESGGEIWTIEGERNVADRAREIVRSSTEEVLIADYPGIVEELEDDIAESDADFLVMTTADTSIPSVPFLEDLRHPVKMNGFIVIGDDEVLVSFESDGDRTGIWSDSDGLLELFQHFFRVTVELGDAARG